MIPTETHSTDLVGDRLPPSRVVPTCLVQQVKKYVSIVDIFFPKEDAARNMSIAP
ncbi:hypothetical protein AB4037_02450 [Labrys sp. KB_33_2]|uniref:hypothetical protein n=1 Tax=Labrys sp. KB_33_2 TaxID=3237479 RepID=UPI003F8FE1F1